MVAASITDRIDNAPPAALGADLKAAVAGTRSVNTRRALNPPWPLNTGSRRAEPKRRECAPPDAPKCGVCVRARSRLVARRRGWAYATLARNHLAWRRLGIDALSSPRGRTAPTCVAR
ncbi:hypothetical protein MTO96_011825 [Rhipicephalus appendiculatus]